MDSILDNTTQALSAVLQIIATLIVDRTINGWMLPMSKDLGHEYKKSILTLASFL
jgi:hypothetical protein